MISDYLTAYMELVAGTEPPKIFQLWSALSASSAVMGRNIWFRHGSNTVCPNMYVMLIGEPGSRKSTAIKRAKNLVIKSGYETVAANKSTKEKFLMDFELGFTYTSDDPDGEHSLDQLLAGDLEVGSREVYIPADEWLAFFGEGNTNFATCLGDLWDYEGIYRERLKNSKSVTIPNPTVSILGGATHDTFKLAFPANLLGHGFLSRMLLIFGERSKERITWPRDITDEEEAPLINMLQRMRHGSYGQVSPDYGALELLDTIYKGWQDLDDARFQHYSTRRFTQLLKLSLILVGQHGGKEVKKQDVLAANTILTYSEQFMSKALGEFGAAKSSAVVQKICSILDTASKAVTAKELWKQVSRDLEKFTDLAQILQNLQHAEKVQYVKEKGGYLPKKAFKPVMEGVTDMELLVPLLKEG